MQVYMACDWALARLSANGDVPISGVQQKGFDCTLIGWVWLNCPLSGDFASVRLGMDYCPLWSSGE